MFKIFKAALKKVWRPIREKKIIYKHQRVADFWHPIIDNYYNNKLPEYGLLPKIQLESQKVIWQYWGQGYENMPEIVQICLESVQKYKGDYTVIMLTDSNIGDYLNFPSFVYDKLKNNRQFTRTFFSDLLRLALLNTYGGIWLDATVMLTGPLNININDDYFLYQRSGAEKHKKYWENIYAYYYSWHPQFKVRMLSSVFFAAKNSSVVKAMYNMMMHFWEKYNFLPDYFAFQILYNEIFEKQPALIKCEIINDCIPHLLQTKINGNYPYMTFEEILNTTNVHKLTYFDNKGLSILKKIL